MTELRDARLKRALDHAPDTAMRPSDATRVAIKSIASEANTVAVPLPAKLALQASLWPRLARWWYGSPTGSSHMPWNAALATVVLASLVTLMWFEQPVPQAVPDEAPAQAAGHAPADIPAPAGVPPAAAVSELKSPPLQNDSRARSRPERDDLAARQSAQPKPELLAKTAGALSEPKTESGPSSAAAPIARRDESGTAAGTVRQSEAVSQSAEMTVAPARLSSPVPSAAPAAAPMPAAPVAAAKAQSAQSELRVALVDKEKRRADVGLAGASRIAVPPLIADWSDLSVQRSGSPLVLSSAQASRLVALLQTVSLRATEASDPEPSAATRIELSRRGERVATIDLGDRWLRWTPVGTDPRSTLIGRVPVAQWEAILDELERLGLRAP